MTTLDKAKQLLPEMSVSEKPQVLHLTNLSQREYQRT